MVDSSIQTMAVAAPRVTDQDLNLYREHFCKQASPAEWMIFVQKCMLYGLNPMLNEIYLVCRYTKDGPSYATQVSITGLIGLAEETGRYEGTSKAIYYDEELNEYPVWPTSRGKHPYAISIGVYKRGHREPYVATLCFHERAQYKKDGSLMPMWQQQGIHMLLKCTLAAALRWEFAERCTGVYIHEEMHMADARAQSVHVVPDVAEDGNAALKQSAVHGIKLSDIYKKCQGAGLLSGEAFYAFCGDVLDRQVTSENARKLTPDDRLYIDIAVDAEIAKLHPAVVEAEKHEPDDDYVSIDQISRELSQQQSA